MNPYHIARYIVADTVNRRTGLEVFAGITTVAVATAIAALCLAFSAAAEKLIEDAIAPTRPLAGVCVLEAAGGLFSPAAEAEILNRLANARQAGEVLAVAFRVTSIESNDLHLADHNDRKITQAFRVWCVPDGSELLRPEFGFPLVRGDGHAMPLDEKPRFECLVNLSYLDFYMGVNLAEARRRVREAPDTLPTQIRLLFPPIDSEEGEKVAVPVCKITVSGFYDEPTYPHLILSMDVAGAYFSQTRPGNDGVKGKLPLTTPFHFYNQNSESPLVSPSAVNLTADQIGRGPKRTDLLQFKALQAVGLSPHDQGVVYLRDWKMPGTRENFRDLLTKPKSVGVIDGEQGRSLANALERLNRQNIQLYLSMLSLSDELLIRVVSPDPGVDRQYSIVDRKSRARLLARVARGKVEIWQLPPYDVSLPQATLTNSLIRVRTIIERYRLTVLVIVGILGFCATFLLAFCHVLRKARDIGLLFVLGAARGVVAAIVIGEVLWIGLVGVTFGLVTTWLARPLLEQYAVKVMQDFSIDAAHLTRTDVNLLQLTLTVACNGVALVLGATVLGGLYPAWRATRTDPLTSLTGGGG